MAIIFLLSGSFCHGDKLAAKLAAELGCRRIEQALQDTLAKRFDMPCESMVRALRGERTLLNRFTRESERNLAHLRLSLADLITDDNLLLHGCAGLLVPRTIDHVLQVCAIANLDYRVNAAVREQNVSEKEALRLVRSGDDDNLKCSTTLVGKSPYDESLYDMVVPMHVHSVDEAAELICAQARSEAVRATDRSRQAVIDFQLAARVQLALAQAGHDLDVFTESGQVTILINEYVVRQARLEVQLKEIASRVDGVAGVEVRLGPKFAPPSLNPWANIEAPKFLLVDDEREFVHTLSERLQTRDLKSSIAYDGEQALALLETDAPEVMVLDLMMPGIDGIEVLRRVKADHPEVEVIILTGHGSDQEREQAEALGAFAYLQKPANIDELARVMKEAYQKANRRPKRTDADHGRG